MKETDFKKNVQTYINRLDSTQRDSFAPIDKLIKNSLDGFDLHVLVLKNMTDLSKHDVNSIQGLVIFNQESNSAKLQGNLSKKVILKHISAIKKTDTEVLFDQTLEFIWKYSHCQAIRLNLFHIKN